jgi:hypothetical protein
VCCGFFFLFSLQLQQQQHSQTQHGTRSKGKSSQRESEATTNITFMMIEFDLCGAFFSKFLYTQFCCFQNLDPKLSMLLLLMLLLFFWVKNEFFNIASRSRSPLELYN